MLMRVLMTEPAPEIESPRLPEDAYHRRLFDRSVILPSGSNTESQMSLADSMLGLAALAPCFALLRESPVLGVAALNAIFPALIRTHLILNDYRITVGPTDLRIWISAFVSSLWRAALTLGIIVLGIGICVSFGVFLGRCMAGNLAMIGGVIAYCVLAPAWTILALFFVAPRILAIRERDGIRDLIRVHSIFARVK
jgi:hypothetical protein